MLRMLAFVALAVAVIATPFALGTTSTAQAAKAATKVCKHKLATGKIKTWRCGADQPCCTAEMLNYYTCGSKALGCL
jgi:hypothetical protein